MHIAVQGELFGIHFGLGIGRETDDEGPEQVDAVAQQPVGFSADCDDCHEDLRLCRCKHR